MGWPSEGKVMIWPSEGRLFDDLELAVCLCLRRGNSLLVWPSEGKVFGDLAFRGETL